MSMKIKDETGNEVEVFTQKELDEKIQTAKDDAIKIATDTATETAKKAADEAIEKYKEDNPDKTKEIDDLKDKLSDAEAKLEAAEDGDGGGEGKEHQVKRLREERDKAVKDMNDKVEGVSKEMKDFRESFVTDAKNQHLDRLSKGDKDLRDKMEFEFDNYRINDTDNKAVEERMTKAFQLATGEKEVPNFMDNSTGASDKGTGNEGQDGKKDVTENSKEIGKTLGISEEDRNKYGPGGEKAPVVERRTTA